MALTDSDQQAGEPAKGEGDQRKSSGLRDRVMAWRDRLIASPRFQRFAADFPLTRPIAQRQAIKLFDLCAGFVYSQVLAACVQLDLFQTLRRQPQTAENLSRRFDIPIEPMCRLLAAAVSLGLLAKRSGDRYGLGMLGAAMTENPGIAAMIAHHAMLYEDLRDPLALLRQTSGKTQLSQYWAYAGCAGPQRIDRDSVAGYTALMSASQQLIAEDILAAYDFRRHKHVIDIGGGDGTFLLAVAEAAPDLEMTLFDLPPVASLAEERFRAHGLGGRAKAVAGSFLSDALPAGADLAVLNRILLDHDDQTVDALLTAARRAMPPDGILLIAEPVSGLTGAPQVSDAYFNLYLFAMGRGRPRTYGQIKQLLHQAGFERVTVKRTRRPLLTNVMTAKPKPPQM